MIKEIYLAGGCFWGMQGYFSQINGVLETKVGYSNGKTKVTDYNNIKKTDHAEVVYLKYNDDILSFENIMLHYFRVIDPFSVNKQGEDIGRQYRTGIYCSDDETLKKSFEYIILLQKKYNKKIVVEVDKVINYVDAEEYHQDYLIKNPTGYCHIDLSLAKKIYKIKENYKMTKTLIFGHKNPDTDSVCSAIVYNYLKKMQGMDTEAVVLGEINEETKYALEYFNVCKPRLISEVNEGQRVILVDHNEKQQSVNGIEKAIIKEVIDHHRIANFETSSPLYYRAEPLGCTATILKKIFDEQEVIINKQIAGLMVSAIISDSLLFKSPTCTLIDKITAEDLAKIADVNLEEYGLNMLKAGASTKDKSAKFLIDIDSKEFLLNNDKIVIAQINTVDAQEVIDRKNELEEVINKEIKNKNLSAFVFIITNILTSDSEVLVLGKEKDKVANSFEKELKNNLMTLEGVVSRKKQVVPQITNKFNN